MMTSEHKPEFVKEVLIAGIIKYERKIKKSQLPPTHKDFKPFHLGTNYDSLGRWKKGLIDNWFEEKLKDETGADIKMKTFLKAGKTSEKTQKTENIKTSTVMFIPSTRGGLLTSKLKEDGLVRMTRFRVKIQEAGGTKLAAMFSIDLAKGESCGRDDCQPFGSGRRLNCKTQSILYESA